ncbi:sugar phosphate isomerase/epimerase family protein [Saccharopolyspora taberi]|uniref:TIM barrel protein n=1 Tax=Saccharopolyspora taberi TaxID=60895 RepID=A0ABN3VED6_9PSEU
MNVRLTGIGDEAALGLADQIAVAGKLGWQALELRTVDGVAMADLDADALRGVRDRLREAELGVACLASRIGSWARPITAPFGQDLAELDALAEQCELLGTGYIRIMSYPNDGLDEREWATRVITRISRLADRAERAGVTLVHENCAGWAGSDGERMLRLVTEVDSPALRLLFDTGNGIEYGYDAADLLEQILPHVVHVHVKDGVRTDGGAVYTLPGDGESRVRDCLRRLHTAGYGGWLSLEPHLAVRPHEGLQADGDSAALFVSAAQRLHDLTRELLS